MNRVFNFSLFSGLMFATADIKEHRGRSGGGPGFFGFLNPRGPFSLLFILVLILVFGILFTRMSYKKKVRPSILDLKVLTLDDFNALYQRVISGKADALDLTRLKYFCDTYLCDDELCSLFKDHVCSYVASGLNAKKMLQAGDRVEIFKLLSDYGYHFSSDMDYQGIADLCSQLYHNGHMQFLWHVVLRMCKQDVGYYDLFERYFYVTYDDFVSLKVQTYDDVSHVVQGLLLSGDIDLAQNYLIYCLIKAPYSLGVIEGLYHIMPYAPDFSERWLDIILTGLDNPYTAIQAYLFFFGNYDFVRTRQVAALLHRKFPNALADLVFRFIFSGDSEHASWLKDTDFSDYFKVGDAYLSDREVSEISSLVESYPGSYDPISLYLGMSYHKLSAYVHKSDYASIVRSLTGRDKGADVRALLYFLTGFTGDEGVYGMNSVEYEGYIAPLIEAVTYQHEFSLDLLQRARSVYAVEPWNPYALTILGYYAQKGNEDASAMFHIGIRFVWRSEDLMYLIQFLYRDTWSLEISGALVLHLVKSDQLHLMPLFLSQNRDQYFSYGARILKDYQFTASRLGLSYAPQVVYLVARYGEGGIHDTLLSSLEDFTNALMLARHTLLDDYPSTAAFFENPGEDYTFFEISTGLESALDSRDVGMIVKLYSLLYQKDPLIAYFFAPQVGSYLNLWEYCKDPRSMKSFVRDLEWDYVIDIGCSSERSARTQ